MGDITPHTERGWRRLVPLARVPDMNVLLARDDFASIHKGLMLAREKDPSTALTALSKSLQTNDSLSVMQHINVFVEIAGDKANLLKHYPSESDMNREQTSEQIVQFLYILKKKHPDIIRTGKQNLYVEAFHENLFCFNQNEVIRAAAIECLIDILPSVKPQLVLEVMQDNKFSFDEMCQMTSRYVQSIKKSPSTFIAGKLLDSLAGYIPLDSQLTEEQRERLFGVISAYQDKLDCCVKYSHQDGWQQSFFRLERLLQTSDIDLSDTFPQLIQMVRAHVSEKDPDQDYQTSLPDYQLHKLYSIWILSPKSLPQSVDRDGVYSEIARLQDQFRALSLDHQHLMKDVLKSLHKSIDSGELNDFQYMETLHDLAGSDFITSLMQVYLGHKETFDTELSALLTIIPYHLFAPEIKDRLQTLYTEEDMTIISEHENWFLCNETESKFLEAMEEDSCMEVNGLLVKLVGKMTGLNFENRVVDRRGYMMLEQVCYSPKNIEDRELIKKAFAKGQRSITIPDMEWVYMRPLNKSFRNIRAYEIYLEAKRYRDTLMDTQDTRTLQEIARNIEED